MKHKSCVFFEKKTCLYLLFLIGGVLVCLFLHDVNFERKKEIARLSDEKIEDIAFGGVRFSFANNAKGIVVDYKIKNKNNEWYSRAYWQPFSSDRILIWK